MSTGSRRDGSRGRQRRVICTVMVWIAMLWTSILSVGTAQPAPDGFDAPAATAGAAAEDGSTEVGGDAAADRSQAFVAVDGASQEDVAGGPLMLGAYALVWLFLLGYVVVLVRRTARTEQDVARLADLLRQQS